jgi:uncharacterized protein (TIGR01777 family)
VPDRIFTRESTLPHSAEKVFAWHSRPGAFERLVPPWSSARVVERRGGIENGSRVTLELPVGPTHVRWIAEHRDYLAGRQFTDVQIEGPFSRWEHIHQMAPEGPDSCRLTDTIHYRLPAGMLGDALGGAHVRNELARTFAYRHRVTRLDLAAHAACESPSTSVAVTGASGLVGASLVPFLRTGGHRVIEIGRSMNGSRPDRLGWAPERNELDVGALDGVEAVVHLAGENIAAGRWTRARKQAILGSRVGTTRFLAERLSAMKRPPRVLISASAIGYYGDTGDRIVSEEGSAGAGFLADVCAQWEAATEPARRAGIRVVNLRIGVVLTPRGGALARMLLPFRLGAGGPLGNGAQFMSWISVDDLIRAIHHAIGNQTLSGAVNAVAPEAVTNRSFARTLGRVLRRPALLPTPALILRAALGEMADELLLASTRVAPAKLMETKFEFGDSDLETALRWCVGRPGDGASTS